MGGIQAVGRTALHGQQEAAGAGVDTRISRLVCLDFNSSRSLPLDRFLEPESRLPGGRATRSTQHSVLYHVDDPCVVGTEAGAAHRLCSESSLRPRVVLVPACLLLHQSRGLLSASDRPILRDPERGGGAAERGNKRKGSPEKGRPLGIKTKNSLYAVAGRSPPLTGVRPGSGLITCCTPSSFLVGSGLIGGRFLPSTNILISTASSTSRSMSACAIRVKVSRLSERICLAVL